MIYSNPECGINEKNGRAKETDRLDIPDTVGESWIPP